MTPNPTPTKDSAELREWLKSKLEAKCYRFFDDPTGTNKTLDELMTLIEAHTAAQVMAAKQNMAMCTDDRTFLEEHKYANVIEYDEKLRRPSRAIYHNRQWEAEKQGLETLAALGTSLTTEQKESK